MPETTAVIEGVETKSGDTNGRAWTKYAVMAGGQFYSTFEKSLVEPAYQLEGKPAVIEFTESGKFKNLVSVKAAENGAVVSEAPKAGDGSYVKATENPRTQRAIAASVALQASVAAYSGSFGFEHTPKQVSEKVRPLAQDLYRFLLQLGGVWDDDVDIPFD